MRVVGLSGKMGCGKSTVANYLLEMLPGAVCFAFAGPLKIEASQIYGFPLELAYTEAGKNSTVMLPDDKNPMGTDTATVRRILQAHGMLRRTQTPGYWDDKMRESLATLRGNGVPCVVVDDVRFVSEANLIKSLGGFVFRINPYEGWNPGSAVNHESETSLDGYGGFDMSFSPAKGDLYQVATFIYHFVFGE